MREEVGSALRERKGALQDRLLEHSMGRCRCDKTVRTWQCRDAQRRLRRKVRAYLEVLRDLKA